MKDEENYIAINKAAWNNKTQHHIHSRFYNLEGFLKGDSSLNEIELQLLGDIQGKSVLHLQCHFGQDTISLARMGASCTGVDLADKAIETAISLTEKTGADARFICCDLYSLPEHLNEQFDIVFTSYGTIGWLPDLNKWAGIVARYLKPGGTFIMAEFHPVIWMYDDHFQIVEHSYFNTGAIIDTEQGTYADRNAPTTQKYVSWNHSLSEVLNNLIAHGLEITTFNEYNYSPYNCFVNAIEIAPKKYQIAYMGDKIPMIYALKATKKQ
ncbi:class I SAM-dependent methyltransferase [Leptobacterium sp. I13]|uniref:class I SAM-dependent methyltransferase n=1 Tax=Leptobacterium meishanense TaxID=3128904 RepID=UPI0030EBCC70